MAQCNSCNRKKVETYPYGGLLLCSSCMNKYNPKTYKVKRFTDYDLGWRNKRISELEKELFQLKSAVTENIRLFKSLSTDIDIIDVIYKYWDY